MNEKSENYLTLSPSDIARDGADGTPGPVYARIRDVLEERVKLGQYKPGERVAPVRTMARLLSINPMTVARAYRELGERGILVSRRGGGSFIASPEPRQPGGGTAGNDPAIDPQGISSRLFELARAPGVIAFTGNYPAVEVSDAESFSNCLRNRLDDGAASFFRYDPPAGRDELREALLPFLAAHSIVARPDDLIVTAGGQQGMDIVARHLLSPGDRVILEQPAYFGAINVVRAAGAIPVPLKFGPLGFDLGQLEAAIQRQKPKLIIINPTFQNPTGHTVPLDQRRGLVELALRTGTPILEDDHCPELRFRGLPLPPLRSLPGGDRIVYYARGFGKVFIPGIRLGVLIPPRGALEKCLSIKATTDLQSPALLQGALADYLTNSDWPSYLEGLREIYRDRQEALHAALEAATSSYGHLSLPDGGLNLWLELDGEIEPRDVYFNAVRRGVAFAIADSFSFHPERPKALRIAFGLTDPADFVEGVERLAAVLHSVVTPQRSLSSAVI